MEQKNEITIDKIKKKSNVAIIILYPDTKPLIKIYQVNNVSHLIYENMHLSLLYICYFQKIL